jgi:hypothetical protein
MKVLFIGKADLPDFQCDMVFHGLRSLLGADCVDANHMWYMYSNTMEKSWNSRVPNNGKSYGNGFTLYGLLNDIDIDRSDITNKIKNKYYDKIVYGSITRCQDYLQDVLNNYEQANIILIDGEDNTDISPNYFGKGVYFKRELTHEPIPGVLKPINFCIPEQLILNKVPTKAKDYASIIPGDLSTYIYDNQIDYYMDYQNSYYGVTTKKGGWDCLRHYEILMNGCIPYFPNIEDCPKNTMTLFPKDLVQQSNTTLTEKGLPVDYEHQATTLLTHTRKYLTTTYTANHILHEK